MNIYDFDHRWRFTARGLCLYRGGTVIGELVRLGGDTWELLGYNCGTVPLGVLCTCGVAGLVAWAEGLLRHKRILLDGAKIDRFALPVERAAA